MDNQLLKIILVIGMTVLFGKVISQPSQSSRIITINKTDSKIIVDGILDDETWKLSVVADGFINKWPIDSGRAKLQTEVKISYDEQYLYFGIKAYLSDKAPVIQSLKRDINPYYSDGVSIVIDPSNKNTSGYTFGVNAGGAQMEGIVQVNSATFDWDTKWYSGTKMYKGFWTAELAGV